MSVSVLLLVELEARHFRAGQQILLAEFHKVVQEVNANVGELEEVIVWDVLLGNGVRSFADDFLELFEISHWCLQYELGNADVKYLFFDFGVEEDFVVNLAN